MPEAIVINNFKTEDLEEKQHLRIAIFTASSAPFLDGVSISVQQRARWLLQQGHKVFLKTSAQQTWKLLPLKPRLWQLIPIS